MIGGSKADQPQPQPQGAHMLELSDALVALKYFVESLPPLNFEQKTLRSNLDQEIRNLHDRIDQEQINSRSLARQLEAKNQQVDALLQELRKR